MSDIGLYSALFQPHEQSDKLFLELDDGALSYREFLQISARQASVLSSAGVEVGDRVAVQAAKTPETLALAAACARIGAALLPLNTSYTPAELEYFLTDASPAALICDPRAEDALTPIADAVSARTFTLDASGSGSLTAEMYDAEPMTEIVPRSGDDLAAILYTSGTTGRSKGAMLSNDNLLSNARTLRDLWQFDASDHLIHALPIFHTHGLFVAVNVAVCAGCSMRFMEKFDADKVFDAIPTATSIMGVPTFYTRMLADPRLTREATAGMRVFISGSAPLLAETHVEFEKRTGQRILERYGMTETNMNTSNPFDGERRAGTVGLPLPGVEVRVTDPETGKPLPQGDRGMIEVRGDNVFQGYWNMPEKTKEEKRENGFFITGDLGEFDEDGYLTIVGRAKDLIISGGYNIYPKEIEILLDHFPGVVESAVVGVPHKDMGEGVVAVLAAGDDVDTDAIDLALSKDLASFKRPRRYYIVDALPRNTMGKVQKAELRKTYAAAFD